MTNAPTAEQVRLDIEGMTCASCANRIERKLNKLDGVTATVNYATEAATVSYDGSVVRPEDLLSAVEAAGYKASLPSVDNAEPSPDAAIEPTRPLRNRLIISAALGLPVLLLSMVPALQFDYWQWMALQLTTPVVIWGGWPFHRAAWTNLRHGTATMDTLVSLGTLSAWAWSMVVLFLLEGGHRGMKMEFQWVPDRGASTMHVYLEVAAVVTVFLLAGRYFEAKAKRRSGAALEALLHLGAKDAAVVGEGGLERRVPVSELQVGQRFIVRPGETVATDGVVEAGESVIDQSMLTGESLPVRVAPDTAVTGGTVNQTGLLTVRVTRIGEETALARIAKLVTEAQSGKAAVQRLADRVSSVFVPAVLVIAAGTLAYWLLRDEPATFAFGAAVAVLIIACPCALGLATPTALLVGTGRGAQMGILIKGPEVLEQTKRVDTILLDKTGTVTTGKMRVTRVSVDDSTEQEALAFAGALESGSNHPIARAVVDFARETVPLARVSEFDEVAGRGVSGVVDGRRVIAGTPAFIESHGLAAGNVLHATISEAQSNGSTAFLVAWDGKARAALVIEDEVKESSAEAVKRLRSLGLTPFLLTGDNERTAQAVSAKVGIDHVIAGVLPEGKVAEVKRLQQEGRVVAMVGDGINDGPALAQADLGLSMGTGTDVAIEASDLTLVSGDLRGAADAIRLSRRTLRTIKSNLFWAFAYNVAALPLAAAGFLSPLVAGAAMAMSSVFVVSNSLRLRRFRPL